jgi:hypothetical protein
LLTNRHVIEDGDHLEEVLLPSSDPPRQFASARIVYIDPYRDLALLKVETKRPLPYLRLATRDGAPVSQYLSRADEVMLWGRRERPRRGGEEFQLTRRIGTVDSVSVQNPAAGPGAFVGLDIRVERGQSGGPIVDRFGRAVGVLTWAWKDRSGGFAIPIAEATRMLAERPNLESRQARTTRATERVQEFLKALRTRRFDAAKRMTSPSFARHVRDRTLGVIAGAAAEGNAMQEFLGALEAVASGAAEGGEERPFELLRDLVERTASTEFRKALGLSPAVDSAQVMAFFYELGTAYLMARQMGGSSPQEALEGAVQRLQTIDAARSFALAELGHRLHEGDFELAEVEILPGLYAPTAVVTLRSSAYREREGSTRFASATVQSDPRGSRKVTVHLRLEWGDWYVADAS